MSAPTPQPAVLKHEWRGVSGARLRLSHYPADGWQDRHAHDHMQVSFLLAGDIEETIGRVAHEMTAPAMCVKPAGADHQDRWGRRGAMMLCLRTAGENVAAPPNAMGTWTRADMTSIGAIVRAAFAAPDPAGIDGVIVDLLGLLEGGAALPASPPPIWLRRVREAMIEGGDLGIDAAADIAGVHRVHLSRSFARHYGVPFSVYRRRVMTARAIEAALRSDAPMAAVAHDAGFADQSHMHRAMHEATGTTPGRLRRALRAT